MSHELNAPDGNCHDAIAAAMLRLIHKPITGRGAQAKGDALPRVSARCVSAVAAALCALIASAASSTAATVAQTRVGGLDANCTHFGVDRASSTERHASGKIAFNNDESGGRNLSDNLTRPPRRARAAGGGAVARPIAMGPSR